MPMNDIGALASVTGFESWRIPGDNIPFSGGTANAYALAFVASGIGSGLHGSVAILNQGSFPLDYFTGGNDAYGMLCSGTAATLAVNLRASFNLDAMTYSSGGSPLTSFEVQVKSSAPNFSGLAFIMPSVLS